MSSNLAAALYTFAAHYHSGQWSRGYRLLCAAERAWKRRAGIGPRLEWWERVIETNPTHPITLIYRRLEADYSGRM